MTNFSHSRRLAACGSVCIMLLSLGGAANVMADAGDNAIEAIVNHPNVARVRAQVCQAASQYDLAAAAGLPQIDFSVRGNSVLSDHFETPPRPNNTPTNSDAEARAFDRENQNIDGVLGIDQLLYDFGGVKAAKLSALSTQAAGRIGVQLEIDRIAANILEIGFTLSEQQQRLALHQAHLEDLEQHVARIEAGVKAGVLRTGDLRSIRVIALDAEIAITAAERQIALLETELAQRFDLAVPDANHLVVQFRARTPQIPPVIDSHTAREVRQIDQQIISTNHEIDRLISERRPRFSTSIDTTFFDVDSFSQEYEMVGQLQMTLPLYDGGSNKARRSEQDWRRRGLSNERENVIRQHKNATEATQRNIETARDSFARNEEKLSALKDRLTEAEARLGETSGDVLALASLKQQITSLEVEQVTISHQIDLGLLQGVFFADGLGELLDLPNGGPQC